MPRGRYIKPSLSKDEDLAECSIHARLLFALLPCYADCEGKLEDRVKRLHVEIYPYEPKLDFDKLLNELDKYNFITRYSSGDGKFIWINDFLENQSPTSGEKKTGSKIPDFNPETSGYNKLEQVTTKPALTKTVTLTKTITKTETETQDDSLVLEIAEFYKTQINSKLISVGIKNLKSLHKKSNIPLKDFFQRVKNYNVEIQRDKLEFRYQMSNFFGTVKAYHESYVEVPELGPQNKSSNSGIPPEGWRMPEGTKPVDSF